MNTWHALEILLVAILVGGSAAFMLRAVWRSVRALSQPATRNGCGGCSGCDGSNTTRGS